MNKAEKKNWIIQRKRKREKKKGRKRKKKLFLLTTFANPAAQKSHGK